MLLWRASPPLTLALKSLCGDPRIIVGHGFSRDIKPA